MDTRTYLKDAITDLRQQGVELYIGLELEFLLLSQTRHSAIESQHAYYGKLQSDSISDVLISDLCDMHRSYGVKLEGLEREFEHGQFELTLPPLDPLAAADNYTVAKYAIKNIATQHGYWACFLPQPFDEGYGNGLHINVSAEVTRAGQDASQVLRDAAYSVALEMIDNVAIFCPTTNSYKRLHNGEFGKIDQVVGFDRRDTLIRLVSRAGVEERCEYRFPDAYANPYLAVGVIAQQVANAKRGEHRGEFMENFPLPASLEEALVRFAARSGERSVTTPAIDEAFLFLKRAEVLSIEGGVTVREWMTYGELPARLKERLNPIAGPNAHLERDT